MNDSRWPGRSERKVIEPNFLEWWFPNYYASIQPDVERFFTHCAREGLVHFSFFHYFKSIFYDDKTESVGTDRRAWGERERERASFDRMTLCIQNSTQKSLCRLYWLSSCAPNSSLTNKLTSNNIHRECIDFIEAPVSTLNRREEKRQIYPSSRECWMSGS